MAKFDRGQVLYGGAPIADLTDGDVELTNGSRDVITIEEGYAGTSDGAVLGTVSCERPVRRAGVPADQDIVQAVLKQREVEVVVVCGGYAFTVTGVPTGVRRRFGVGTTLVENFSVHGKAVPSKL